MEGAKLVDTEGFIDTRTDVSCKLFNNLQAASYKASSEVCFELDPASHLWVRKDGGMAKESYSRAD